MISIVNRRVGGDLFHYAHFICDCLYPEIINDVHTYDSVVRLHTIKQTLGNFTPVYEEIMDVSCIYVSHIAQPTIFPSKEAYTDVRHMMKFREFIFRRFPIQSGYPEVLLIRRGSRIQLLDDPELSKINTNVTTGSERREIADIDRVEAYMAKRYPSFRTVILEGESFHAQVNLFHNAKLIVLAHGAAMSNMFFCKPGTTIVEVVCGKKWPFFDVISNKLQLRHIKLHTNTADAVVASLEGCQSLG